MASQPLSKVTTVLISALAAPLVAFGGGLLFAPQPLSNFFGLQIGVGGKPYAQAFGVRILTVGAVLLELHHNYAKSIAKGDGVLMDIARRDLKRVLVVSMAWDCVDLACCMLGYRNGEVSSKTFGWFGGGEAAGIALAGLALRAL